MKVIGIDIGTTTISLVVLDTEKKAVLESRTVPNGTFIRTEKEWERIQNPDRIVEKAMRELKELRKAYKDVETIGLTGQMHGILYIDEDGNCVSPLYTWQDGRGNLPEFDGKSVVCLVKEETGFSISTGYGLATHLYHCKKNQVPKNAVSFCTISDYLGMKLTGRKTPIVHISNAASLGLFDSEKMMFYIDTIHKLGMDPGQLPEVTDEFKILGYYDGIPVTVALGDNQASFLGSVGFQENTFVVQAGGEDKALYEVLKKLARAAMNQENPVEVSTLFNGTRTDPTLRGSITNISENNFTPEGITYGVLHGMIKELYDMYQQIHQGTGIQVSHLVASGNGMRKNKVLQEISSEIYHWLCTRKRQPVELQSAVLWLFKLYNAYNI